MPDSSRPISDTPGYGQLCALGFALDAVGDRWTLLVLRDLARADLRFGELQAINPGMSPNLLTDRLRKLEAAGLVARRSAGRAGSGQVYALTDDTRQAVLPLLTAAAELGSFLIDRIPPDDMFAMDLPRILADQMQLNGHFVVPKSGDLEGYFVLDMAGIQTHLVVAPGRFDAAPTAPDGEVDPVARLQIFPPTILMRMMGRAMTTEDAEASGLLMIEGDRDAGLALIEALSFST